MYLGQILRKLREKKGMLLREVAAQLEIDTAMISKIERGEKSCKRDHLQKLSKLFDVSEKELIIQWLSDNLFSIVENEKNANEALKRTLKRIEK